MSGLPLCQIVDRDLSALEHFREGAAAPTGPHRFLQTRQRLVHPFARACFAIHPEARASNSEKPAARLGQVYALEEQIGAALSWVEGAAELGHQRLPARGVDQRDLTTAAAVRVAVYAFAGSQHRVWNGIHLAPMAAFYPDAQQPTWTISSSVGMLGHDAQCKWPGT